MQWILLGFAIILEVAGTVSMKLSNGFTKLLPSILMVLFYLFSFGTLNFALKTIDVSVAYAIWSGMGIILITCIGFLYFNESLSLAKILSIILILIGVVTLNLAGVAHSREASEENLKNVER